MTADPRLDPPIAADTLDGLGKHSYAWTNYHQEVADRIYGLPAKLRAGVSDGSDAAAGDVGEYLEATFAGPVSLPSLTTVDLGSLPLTAGDWDVSGVVVFLTATGMAMAQAWVSTASVTPPPTLGRGIIVLTPGLLLAGTRLNSGPLRVSQASAGPVYLGAFVTASGAVTAAGTIRARRMR